MNLELDKMAEENKNNINIPKTISPETKIVFTLKMFITTILTILGIFASFYFSVVAPKLNEQKADIGKMNEQLMEISNGIGVLNGNIEGINNRFKDLNRIRDIDESSGGSLGN